MKARTNLESVVAGARDAAAVLLLRQNENASTQIYWAKRSPRVRFFAGFRAFPGGAREEVDGETVVENCVDEKLATLIACAARELFEETGVLVARGGHKLTKGQRASLLDDLMSGRMTFAALLRHFGLHLDARDFEFIGRWVTPPFSARRFDTYFFFVRSTRKQEPHLTDDGELENGEWIAAREALMKWQRGEALMASPLLHILRTIESSEHETHDELIKKFLAAPHAHGTPVRFIEFIPNIFCVPLLTPTLPPATHTNCYIVAGARELLVIDPASPYEDEQNFLASCVDEFCGDGKRRVREIILTHHHPDHIGGVEALQKHLGAGVKVAAHRLTAESLQAHDAPFRVERFIEDDEVIELERIESSLENQTRETSLTLRALHTPGHARGHLCFYEARTGALLSGDNVTSLPTVFVGYPHGDMREYLASLERMKNLPHLKILLGAHGTPVADARRQIERYIAHRLERERQILEAIDKGARALSDIVEHIYASLNDERLRRFAEKTIQAHLVKLAAENRLPKTVSAWQHDHALSQQN